MLMKIVGAIIAGTLILGGLTAKCADEAVEQELNRYEQYEQQIDELLE